nr:RNA-directed DNA polymerase, eukaryota, reverse transcriptase zinc-binding domain protein [Tanacetum cinerariifolium]
FKSEDGMKKVLESGPWMVQNVPLVLNVWEPRIWLDKTEPSLIPIWVCVYNIPMELCNGNGIGKIMSGVGKPLLMDNMTKERTARLLFRGVWDRLKVVVGINGVVSIKNFRPKVLVRGSGFAVAGMSSLKVDVPVRNSFQVFDDQVMQDKEECVLEDMEEEYNSEIWPKLKQDVVDIMESGSYPSSSIRVDWSLA